jgi:hypothetical protein
MLNKTVTLHIHQVAPSAVSFPHAHSFSRARLAAAAPWFCSSAPPFSPVA